MLTGLHIKNIAVIDEVNIEFNDGFNVLTGETGAGKSIIIDSINMVLGQRTSKDLIRFGEKKAVVEAVFSVTSEEILNRLADMGIEAEDGTVIIYRDLSADGRSTSRINGQLVTAGMVRDVSEHFINIHGQHDNQALLSPSKHIDFLDDVCGMEDDIAVYREAYELCRKIEKETELFNIDENTKLQRIDLLSFQINEISRANLKSGEEEELKERRKMLLDSGAIAETLQNAKNALYEGDDMQSSVHDLLSIVDSGLASIAKYDKKLDELQSRLSSVSIELDDIIYQINDFADSIEYGADEIEALELRLDTINGLKRKYGQSIDEILAYYENAENELNNIQQSEEQLKKLEELLAEQKTLRSKAAGVLTKKRLEGAEKLEQRVAKELSDLDMNNVIFKVDIKQAEYNANGADWVEFLISTNEGEPPKPLAKIASGGEMSRIMLAIKTVLADSDYVPTLIFDEIDTGVSGRAAHRIAEKLYGVSKSKQVLCITHLAQIAVMADSHYLIEKNTGGGKTATQVSLVEGGQREGELARIIGGAYITETTLKNAGEMIIQAQNIKERR